MLTHGCAATFLLITQCYAHHGRLPPAANRIWIFRKHTVAAFSIRKSPVSRNTLVGAMRGTPVHRAVSLIAEAHASPLEAGDGRRVVRTLPSLVATLPLPHPLPSSSPLSPFRFAAMASSAQSASQRANLCCISNVRDAFDWSASGGLCGMLTANSNPVNAHRTTRGIAQCQTRS